MQKAINQIRHNEDFYACICKSFPDNFYDWKITILFYIAIHYLKALAYKSNVKLPASHYDIEHEVNPKKGNILHLTYKAWDWYFDLYLCSRTARYDGFVVDQETYMLIKKADYEMCEKNLNKFRNYMKGKGIEV